MKKQNKGIIFSMLFIFIFGLLLIGEIELASAKKNVFGSKGRILVKGAPIHGGNGLMFDDDDRLHIACVLGNEIVVMNPRNGKILERIGTDKGVFFPDDLTFGLDGSLYWTDIINGNVGRLSPDGITTKQPVVPGVKLKGLRPGSFIFCQWSAPFVNTADSGLAVHSARDFIFSGDNVWMVKSRKVHNLCLAVTFKSPDFTIFSPGVSL